MTCSTFALCSPPHHPPHRQCTQSAPSSFAAWRQQHQPYRHSHDLRLLHPSTASHQTPPHPTTSLPTTILSTPRYDRSMLPPSGGGERCPCLFPISNTLLDRPALTAADEESSHGLADMLLHNDISASSRDASCSSRCFSSSALICVTTPAPTSTQQALRKVNRLP